jgi:hypothetical protein
MPTKKKLSLMREAEFEYPQIRREDDPGYKKPEITKTITHMESKAMTPEQLLAPRYEVIAEDTTGDFVKGQILVRDDEDILFSNYFGFEISEDTIKALPHLFNPLQWWERREASEMPEYYKYSGNHGVFKTSFRINGDIVMLNFSPTETVPVNLAYCLPATKSEYDQYIKSKEK